jgi:hypothetical protein
MTQTQEDSMERGRVGGRGGRWAGGVLLAAVVLAMVWFIGPPTAGAAAPPSGKGGARLEIDRDVIDFGRQPYGKVVQAVFVLRNVGEQILLLPSSLTIEVVEGC